MSNPSLVSGFSTDDLTLFAISLDKVANLSGLQLYKIILRVRVVGIVIGHAATEPDVHLSRSFRV